MKTSWMIAVLVGILGLSATTFAAPETPADATTPAAIAAHIERYRKGDLTVVVHDAQGHPLADTPVHVAMTRHAFLFGCNIFLLRPEDTELWQKTYQDEFAALFNYATVPFYWGSFEHQQGQPQYERLDAMVQWCGAHGITPKGHPLVWHNVYPKWAPVEPEAAIPLLHQRVTDIITHYSKTIHYWDVLNEANSPDLKTGEGAWIKRDGPAAVVGTALDWARAAGTGTPETFLYNDYRLGPENVALLTKLQAAGKLPDVIGIQSHMHGGTWPLERLWHTCETYAAFGRPLHFTETTVISGPKRQAKGNEVVKDWFTTPEDEVTQADYVVKFYSVLFSHPAMRAITWWDFSDRGAWKGAPAGMVRRDMTPKPVYNRLLQLVHKDWWTDATERSDAQGAFRLRAFYGDYTITATDAAGHVATQTLSWPEAAPARQVVLTMP